MNTRLDSAASGERSGTEAEPSWIDRLARRMVLSRLEKLQLGRIAISENGEQVEFGQSTPEFPTTAQLRVKSPKFYSAIAFGGSIGAGEAYISGHWACNDLSELLRILIRNREVLEKMDSGVRHCRKRFMH
jgi:cyclopropane-fatty-acyl-phospholipid synthase